MGVVFSCFEVRLASSSAVTSPAIVTIKAASLRTGGMVITGVLKGRILEVKIRPATMLPQASRLIGLITCGSFSLIGERGKNRGVPIETKKITRRLYAAVNEVAISVRIRAQAFRYEVFRASIIASLEKNPARKGVPVRARLPIVVHVDVNGARLWSPPIFRISCSSLRL